MSWIGAGIGLLLSVQYSGKLLPSVGFMFPAYYFKINKYSEWTKNGIETFACTYFGSILGSASQSALQSFFPCALAALFAASLDLVAPYAKIK